MKSNETKWNQMKSNEIKWNQMNMQKNVFESKNIAGLEACRLELL